MPREDRWHRKPTPTLGGMGMFFAFLSGILCLIPFNIQWSQLRSLLFAAGVMFLLGIVDDFKRLSPPSKLVIQILAAAVVVFFGRVIHFFSWELANVFLTFFWIVGITNAINLLDNMDGLAGDISLIACGFLAYFFWTSGSIGLLLLALCLAGSILGFLIFNFPPAKIFMGDSGSMFLGFTLASLAVARRPHASEVLSTLGVPILLFLLPILDTTLVTVTRILRGQSPAQGGTDHTSHRLIAFGLSERQAVLFLYAIGIISGLSGLVSESLNYDLSLLIVPVVLIGLTLIVAYLGRLKVVSTYSEHPGNITRIMVNLTYKRRLLEILLDFFIIAISFYLAFMTLFGMQVSITHMNMFTRALPMAVAGVYLSFYMFNVYRGVWRYVSMDDLVRYGIASLTGVIAASLPVMLFYPRYFPEHYSYPPELFILFALFLFLGLTGTRASFRILDRVYSRRQANGTGRIGVLLYGAEDAGELTLRWLAQNPSMGYAPVGFIDNDPLMQGRSIHGVSVLGGCDKMEAELEKKQAAGLIVTSQELLSNPATQELIATCRKHGVWVRVLKLDLELYE